MTQRDLVFLVADSAMEQLLRGFFGREQFHRTLGCRPFSFDPRTDLIVAPTKDPGVHSTARELLRPMENRYGHAVVMLDADWNGSPGAEKIREHITEALKPAWDEFVVIVLEPEIEAWLWQDNPNVAKALKCREDFRTVLHYSEHWPQGQAKPHDPKDAWQYLCRKQRADSSNAVFKRLAASVATKHCQDEAHKLLVNTLRTWFPESPQ